MSVIDLGDQRVPVPPAPRFDQDDNWGKQRLLRTDEAKRAAAMAVGNLVADFATNPQTPQQAETAGRILGEIADSLGVSPEPVHAAAAPAAAPAVTVPDYELPEEVAELLDEPDFSDDEPVVDEALEPVAEEQVEESNDPEVAKLKKRLAAAEKKAEHERKLRVQSSRKDWETEARTVFNKNVELLSDAEIASITADSKRGFFAQAKEIADRNKELAARFGGGQPVPQPVPPAHDPNVWGKPTVGDPTAPAGSIRQAEKINAARRTGRLSESIKAMIYPD